MTAPLSEWEREARERLERSLARRESKRDPGGYRLFVLFILIVVLALAIVLVLNAVQGLH